MLGVRYEYVILQVAWRPLVNTFVQASDGMSATAEVLVELTFCRAAVHRI